MFGQTDSHTKQWGRKQKEKETFISFKYNNCKVYHYHSHRETHTHRERNNTNKIQTQKNLKLFSQDNRKKDRKRKNFEKFFISIFCCRFLYVADFFACSVNSFWLKVKSCKKKIRKQQKKKKKQQP